MRPGPYTHALAVTAILAAVSPADAQSFTESDRRTERSVVDSIQAELLPEVCSLVGFDGCEPIPIEVWTRAELRLWMLDSMDRAFPQNEWLRLGRCLAEIGLSPKGIDLQDELLELLVSQAGAGYSPELGSYVSLLDVPANMKSPAYRKMVIAHELTHAFQDQAVDMETMHLADLSSLDRSFAHRAAFEGMASVVMYSLGQGLPLSDLPDVAAFMRETFTRSPETLTGAGSEPPPEILVKYLFEPYVAGSSFVQHILGARPEVPLVYLLAQLPPSGEQILHPEKYLSGDLPTPIDLSRIKSLLPDDWREFHQNEIGEQDLRLLFTLGGSTPQVANEAASGWDGFSFAGFVDRNDSLALAGVSVWDSPEDAGEFSALFEGVLEKLHGEGAYGIKVNEDRVTFVVGFNKELTEELLSQN